jgi:uncharacterized protein with HEPN domain
VTKASDPYFALIFDSLDLIEFYRPETKEEFFASPTAQDAVNTRLQAIGECLFRVRKLDEEQFDVVAPRSWRQVIGLRHRISHGYHLIDQDAVGQIISIELPLFRESLESTRSKV